MEWIVQLPILFFSIMFHEVSHGLIALRNGDDTARRHGRLSFNPLVHVDPVGTIFLPVLCLLAHVPPIGWAKPVPVDAGALRDPRWAMVRVAMIGPASNIFLSFAAALLFKLTAIMPAFFPPFQGTMLNALLFAVQVNLMLAFFNLIPIYPLDGSKVLSGLLPLDLRRTYERHIPYGFVLILLFVYLGVMRPFVMIPSALVLGFLVKLGLIW